MEEDLSRLVQDGRSVTGEQVGDWSGAGRWWLKREVHGMGHGAMGFEGSWLQAWKFRSRVAPIGREVKGEFYASMMNLRG